MTKVKVTFEDGKEEWVERDSIWIFPTSTQCKNHDGKPCGKMGRPHNVRTLNTKQIIVTILCDDHIKGEDYSGNNLY